MINLYNRVMAWAGDVWGWIVIGAIITMILILMGFFLNLMGIGGANFIIAIPFLASLIGLLIIPDITINILTAAVVSGIFQQPQTVRSEVKTFFLEYIKFIGGLIFGLLLIFCFLGFIPISESPMVFFALAILIPTTILTCIFFEFEGNWGKKLTYWSLVLLIAISFARLIPDDVYKQFIGFSPFSLFHRSETQKILEEVEKQIAKNIDKAQAEKLQTILDNLGDKKDLTEAEQVELNKIREKVSKKSLPAQTKKLGGIVIEKTERAINETVHWWQSQKLGTSNTSANNKKGGLIASFTPQKSERFGKTLLLTLSPGEYSIDPPNTEKKSTRFRLKGETEYKKIGEGKNFVVSKVLLIEGFFSDWEKNMEIKIYRL